MCYLFFILKAFIRMLVDFTEDQSEKRRLQELASVQGIDLNLVVSFFLLWPFCFQNKDFVKQYFKYFWSARSR